MNDLLIWIVFILFAVTSLGLLQKALVKYHIGATEPIQKPRPSNALRKPPQSLSLKQLEDFNGIKRPEIFVAIRDPNFRLVIFDVTNDKEFTCMGTKHCFAGKDITSYPALDSSGTKVGPPSHDELEKLKLKYFEFLQTYDIVGKVIE